MSALLPTTVYRPARRLGAFLFATVAATAALRAQCGTEWQDGPPAPGPLGSIRALLQLSNGEWIAGGQFRIADGAVVNNIARWDGVTWHALGTGTSGEVSCLAQLPNGDLLAGGSFAFAGGQPAAGVARWNGQTWASIGVGPGPAVRALRVAANGNLIAGGAFYSGGSTTNVMQWDGVTWSVLGVNPIGATHALAWLANGDLVAGGSYWNGQAGYGLQRWDGTSWQPIPGFDAAVESTVDDVATRPNGDLVIVGSFRINGVPATLAVWDGTTMQAIATPAITVHNGSPRALAVTANGDVLLGAGGNPNLARWNGTSWSPIAGGYGVISELAEDAAGNVVAGFLNLSAFPPSPSVRRFGGSTWNDLGAGQPPLVQTMTRLPNGDVVAGGMFSSIEGTSAAGVASWNGTSWSPLGLGVTGWVEALATAPNGDLLVGGWFTAAGGAPVVNIARWDGQSWSTLGAGLPLPFAIRIRFIAAVGGEVLAMTNNNVLFRFDGLQWQQLALPAVVVFSTAMLALPNGDVLIGGLFVPATSSQVGLMRYSAGTLTPVAGAPPIVTSLALTDDGAVLVQGSGSLQRWDGSTWTPLPSVGAAVFAQLANGELVACGTALAVGGAPTSALFRLRAGGWESCGEITGGQALALATTARGEVLVGGRFVSAGNVVSCGLARSSPTCPATAVVFGSGCSGGAGPVTLSATSGAWVGGTLHTAAHVFPAGSLAVQVAGVQNTVTALPGGAPGCSLFVLPILTGVLVPSGGTAASAFAIPAQPALAGQQFRLQVVGIELAGASILRLTSTNALDVTIGTL